MKENSRKLIKIATIIVCLGLAGAIVYISRPARSGLDSVSRGQMIWVKCRNPDCAVEYQIDNKDYWEYVEEHRNPMSLAAPSLICRDCEADELPQSGSRLLSVSVLRCRLVVVSLCPFLLPCRSRCHALPTYKEPVRNSGGLNLFRCRRFRHAEERNPASHDQSRICGCRSCERATHYAGP